MTKILLATTLLGALSWAASIQGTTSSSPVLVELFTSEGCSSCPPADALLEKLEQASAPGKEIVVLSEHVDYWNHIGWNDPYSSSQYTDRQHGYASRFRLESVYTPQMVVDGSAEFVGSDAARAKSAILAAMKSQKTGVRIVAGDGAGKVRVEVDALPANASVFLALASNEATSQVKGGENGGRRLHHVAVVRTLTQIGDTKSGAAFTKDVSLPALKGLDPAHLRIVAFVQEHGQGKVLGVAMRPMLL